MATMSVSRRDFLRVTGLTAASALSAACAGAATPAPAAPTVAPAATTAPAATVAPATAAAPAATTAPAAPVSKYTEAPSLAAKVAAGELPPVDERVSEEPMLIECVEEPGEYSGDMHNAMTGGDTLTIGTLIHEFLVRWDYRSGGLTVSPNVVQSWDIEDDGATYIFHLRKGMRWSDGEPFTADDIMFWYQDMQLNEELTPSFPNWLIAGDSQVVIEKVDDYTVTFKFAVPYAILLETLCFRGRCYAPAHYLKQFHPAYSDADELAAKVKEAAFEDWFQLFGDRNNELNNVELPVIHAWQASVPYPEPRVILDRNPYYWKVDTNGKQLPYFDRLVTDVVQSQELVLMKAIAGELDLQYKALGFINYSLLRENEESGGYRVLEWLGGGLPSMYMNQTFEDPAIRELWRNRDFRYALSYAVNRQEMNDLFWFGLAEPVHPCGMRGDPFWQEGFGTNAVEYEPDTANTMLDALGLDKRDADGWRLLPDGQPLLPVIETFPFESGAAGIDIYQQVVTYWQAVGINAQVKEEDGTLWRQRMLGNQVHVGGYSIARILWILDPGWYLPVGSWCYYAPLWQQWTASGGTGGEEPPSEIKEMIGWFEQLKIEPDEQKRVELGSNILRRHHEEIYIIGTCSTELYPVVVKKDIVNVLETTVADYRAYHDAITWPFQVWRRPA